MPTNETDDDDLPEIDVRKGMDTATFSESGSSDKIVRLTGSGEPRKD